MHFFIEQWGLFPGWLAGALFIFLRYVLFAGLAFVIVYYVYRRALAPRKIQAKDPRRQRIMEEVSHSAITALVFACVGLVIYGLRTLGMTQIYTEITDYSWGYALFSFVLLIVIHDAYFYWMHRAMHHPKLFRIFHLVHHQSNNPTPWASLAFHPLEALVEIAIIPVVILFIPFHPVVLLVFVTWSLSWNVIGHLGFEVFPAGWVDHPILRWLNTSTHHNMHHRYSQGNYGLYFNWWDHWMGTNHPEYQQTYREITEAL